MTKGADSLSVHWEYMGINIERRKRDVNQAKKVKGNRGAAENGAGDKGG